MRALLCTSQEHGRMWTMLYVLTGAHLPTLLLVLQGTTEALEVYGEDLLWPMQELCTWAGYFGADRHGY